MTALDQALKNLLAVVPGLSDSTVSLIEDETSGASDGPEAQAIAIDQAITALVKIAPQISDAALSSIYDDIRATCSSEVVEAWNNLND